MRTPLIVLAGQGDTAAVSDRMVQCPGTVLVEHRLEGHIVVRTVTTVRNGFFTRAHQPLELAHGCVACTIRNDLLILLRKLHRRADIDRIVVRLEPWLEPEPVCFAIKRVRVSPGPDYVDGPASRDVDITAVITCVDTDGWLQQALADDTHDDGRTVAQILVAQVEFADVVVLDHPDSDTLAVVRRLAPAARVTVGHDRVELALANLESNTRRGRSDDPHSPLLAGQPPLDSDGQVRLVEFSARRPFHPERLHEAVDLLLEGVVRSKGRLWLANRSDRVMWLESAGGGMLVTQAGKWLAAMTSDEVATTELERRAIADMIWDCQHGDRHTSMVVLVCGADPRVILDGLTGALLTDDEMRRPADWQNLPDPFGDWHADPCEDVAAPAGLRDGEESGQSH